MDRTVRETPAPDVVDRRVRKTSEPDIEEVGNLIASSRSSISDPRTPYGLPYEDYPIDDDELDGVSLSYDKPHCPQKSHGSCLTKGELQGQNKDEFRLGLDWLKAENPIPRAALTYNIRRVCIQQVTYFVHKTFQSSFILFMIVMLITVTTVLKLFYMLFYTFLSEYNTCR